MLYIWTESRVVNWYMTLEKTQIHDAWNQGILRNIYFEGKQNNMNGINNIDICTVVFPFPGFLISFYIYNAVKMF